MMIQTNMPSMMRSTLSCTLLAAGLFTLSSAHAVRPLITDDAAVNDRGQCQIEVWQERTQGVRGPTLAPACGIADGLEFGVSYTRYSPVSADAGGYGLQLKTVFESIKTERWAFGAKLNTVSVHNRFTRGYSPDEYSVTLLGSGKYGNGLSLHTNLGVAHDRTASETSATYGVAVVQEFGQAGFVFAELTGDHRSGAFRNAGAAVWLIPERLSIDFSAGRKNGGGGSTEYTIGLGFYGTKVFGQ